MDDLINRQAAIDIASGYCHPSNIASELAKLPSAQPTEASCWGCNCPKMERLKEQKTFSEMVHLHDAETHEERTKTHACDYIERQAAIDAVASYLYKVCLAFHDYLTWDESRECATSVLQSVPTAHRPVDEWCVDCAEYDTERKCCPRFNRVIRTAVDDAQPRWIPVTERLPDEDGRYLCDYGNQCVDFGLWTFGQWYVSGVVAWMPKPEPYKPPKEET